MAAPVLEAKKLSVSYKRAGEPVLRDLNFEAYEGEFVLVAGPSGGGKSTLIHSLNGIIPHMYEAEVEGQILCRGEDITDYSVSERARLLGTVMQNPDEQLIFETVEDELAFPLENMAVPQAEMQQRIDRVLEMIALPATASPDVLSGGEKQKLVAGSTLIMGQRVLLFDEVLANLDKEAAHDLLQRLSYLCQSEGYTVVFIEHRLDWVLPYADRIYWVNLDEVRVFHDAATFRPYWQQQLRAALAFDWPAVSVPEDADVLLEAIDLTYSVPGKEVLARTNFCLRRGERWVLTGANGSGKTSFLNLLARLTKPTAGKVRQSYGRKERYKKIGVIMQDPNYQLFMSTVREEIAFQAVSEERVAELIEALGLQGLEERHPQSLSEGQKRKVGVAAILAMDPEVLLFDEPTVGLDYDSLGQLLRELKRMDERSRLTMLTITHDERAASFLGDRVIRIEQGQLDVDMRIG